MKPTLYDGVVLSNTHVAMHVIDDEETLILKEESRSKMSEKAKDPRVIANKISHKPIDYENLNSLIDDFEKRFSPQQELSAEQAFWFHIGGGYQRKGQKRSQNDKTEHENGKSVKQNSKLKVNPGKVKALLNPRDGIELLNKLLEDVQNISEELAEFINSPSWSRHAFYLDDDEEYTIAITPDLPTEEPQYSLSMGDEHLDTIPATESDKVIKSSVENLFPIPSESEVTSDNESQCDVPVDDESSPTFTTFLNPLFDSDNDFSSSDDESFSDEDISKEIYLNPLFDEEIISDKIDASIISFPKIDSLLEQFSGKLAHIDLIPPGINEETMSREEEHSSILKIMKDPVFVFNLAIHRSSIFCLFSEYQSDDHVSGGRYEILFIRGGSTRWQRMSGGSTRWRRLANQSMTRVILRVSVRENIESKDSSNLDEPTLLVTPLSDANEDECFDPGGVIDKIDAFLDMDISTDIEDGYHDLEGDIIYLESLLIDDTIPNLPRVFLVLTQECFKDDADNDDLMTEDKVFGIYKKSFSSTFVKLTFEDRHYFPIIFVIRIFLPYPTYSVDSIFLLSFGSKDTIFDPGISTFHFSSLKPVAYENPIVLRIENKAKTRIFGFDSFKFTYYLKSRRSPLEAPSTPLERARSIQYEVQSEVGVAGTRLNGGLGIRANHWFVRRSFRKVTWQTPIGGSEYGGYEVLGLGTRTND
ncbi:hypothetical protein Tco_1327000 [Tanacetum coccineum]